MKAARAINARLGGAHKRCTQRNFEREKEGKKEKELQNERERKERKTKASEAGRQKTYTTEQML